MAEVRPKTISTKMVAADNSLYDAFVSYSHKADGRLAPALRTGLHRFAKPWYRLRAMRVFHDDASMVADPNLWQAILNALQVSRYFIYLASPTAAGSRWVQDEITWWLGNRPCERMLIVLTDGELVWDREAGDFDWEHTTAFPQEVAHGLSGEPLWLDLRWARREEDLSLRNPNFQGAIANLSAALTGRSKDELIGGDVRRHRQTRRITWAAAAGLAGLAVASTVAASIAVVNQREAERQQRIAEDRSKLAQSRQLAAQSTAALTAGAVDRALLLAIESENALAGIWAPGPADDHDARAALFAASHARPNLASYLARGRSAGDVELSTDGLIGVDMGGEWHFWREIEAKSWTAPAGTAPPDETPVIADFREVWPVLAGALTLLDPKTGAVVGKVATGQSGALYGPAVNSDGSTLAVGAGDGTIFLWKAGTPPAAGRRLAGHSLNVVGVAFSPDGALLASASWDGDVRLWNVETGRELGDPLRHRSQGQAVAFSPDGMVLSTGSDTGVRLWNPATGEPLQTLIAFRGRAHQLAFHPDGSVLYVAGPEGSEIARFRMPEGSPLQPLEGHSSRINSIALEVQGRFLVSTGLGGEVLLWRDPAGDGRGSVRVADGDAFNLVVAPDGRTTAVEACIHEVGRPCAQRTLSLWQVSRGADSAPVLSRIRTAELGPVPRLAAIAFTPAGTLMTAACTDGGRSKCIGLSLGHRDAQLAAIGETVEIDRGVEIQAAMFSHDATRLAHFVIDRRLGGRPSDRTNRHLRLSDTATGDRLIEGAPAIPDLPTRPIIDPMTTLALGNGVAVRLEDGALAYELPDRTAAFSPDGKSVVTVQDPLYGAASIRVWDAQTGMPRSVTATALDGTLTQVAIAPDARLMAIADAAGRVTLWDLAARAQLGASVPVSQDSIYGLTFAEDGILLASAGMDGCSPSISTPEPCGNVRAQSLGAISATRNGPRCSTPSRIV